MGPEGLTGLKKDQRGGEAGWSLVREDGGEAPPHTSVIGRSLKSRLPRPPLP